MRRDVHDVGLCELVLRGVFVLVIRGGSDGGLVAAGFMGGDIVGGEAVIVAILLQRHHAQPPTVAITLLTLSTLRWNRVGCSDCVIWTTFL